MLPKVDLALVRIIEDGERRRVYECASLFDEPALIVAERGEVPRADALGREPPGPITISASIGRFGDKAREDRIVALVMKRLRDLAGVPYAPVR